ncbi:MAG: DUF4297 domain-containing protein [Gammaproteobacteria bacterium]|nr:DUF4297 domain-containing protein [Gammaproteobacteria bacterium]MBU1465305.1 DUF4297 domain-containing protein [Gammaproteobacteria bacterium]MBU2023195.1 DUF4297 domain-containing protein [Gammaproteobacteria bacterium]MBU2239993.1 DUF4297 domain-containing protein [Gammaproteobacteria bacterium]MBU2317519.1 DUF4297 domain-containing protein [Gammaproteobacteria bacterium]
MKDRSAVDTIRGYFYQFDYSILKLLQLTDLGDSISIECIEDVDINTATEVTAVQCKYYEGTDYNHSVIKPAVMLMLTHFRTVKQGERPLIRYSLRGHYHSGQHKLTLPIDVAFLKQHFLTYNEKKIEHRHHEELGLSDTDLVEFLSILDIDINAASFDDQFSEIIQSLQATYNCTRFEAEYFYYNNALALTKQLSIQSFAANRTITKKAFLERSDTSGVLFNEWFVRKKGEKAHFAELKKTYFSNLNLSPFERFFLIEVDPETYVRSDLKEVLHLFSKKWSKTSKRDGNSAFCPYVYVHGLHNDELIELKKELAIEEFGFIDGYDFQGADFSVKSIATLPIHDTGIKLKLLNSIVDLEATVGGITKTREVYQFYLGNSYFDSANKAVKHVRIQVNKLTDIKVIV